MKKIWVDAGHGGGDPGALGPDGRSEKGDTLRLALLLDGAFRRQGCETVLTRTEDETMSLSERTKLERDGICDLAIACHRNAGPATARGLEIWLHTNAPESYRTWAKEMAGEIEDLGLPLRNSVIPQRVAPGVFRGFQSGPNENYYANSATNSPSMLIELGFITSEGDNAFFDAQLERVAEGMVRASCRFLGIAYSAPPLEQPVQPTPQPEVDYKAKFEGLLGGVEGLLREYGV